jgi:hypothetical protein
MFSITYVLGFSQPSHLSRILSANRVLLRHLPKSAGRDALAESIIYTSHHDHVCEDWGARRGVDKSLSIGFH